MHTCNSRLLQDHCALCGEEYLGSVDNVLIGSGLSCRPEQTSRGTTHAPQTCQSGMDKDGGHKSGGWGRPRARWLRDVR